MIDFLLMFVYSAHGKAIIYDLNNNKKTMKQKRIIISTKQKKVNKYRRKIIRIYNQPSKSNNKTMFRAIPISNKICFDKELKRNWKIHQQKIQQMKSKVSKQRAQQFTFLEQTKKRNVLKDIENRQIQRSNHVLFKKIQQIERKGNKCSYLQIDQKNKQKVNTSMNRTLHEPFRKKELFRIVEQNQEMLRRIKQKKSAYDVKQMEKQRKNVEKNISLISQFKYKNYPETHTKVNLYMKQDAGSNPSGSRVTNTRQTIKNLEKAPNDPIDTEVRCKTSTKSKVRVRHTYFSQTSKQLNDRHYIITTYVNKNVFYIEVENLENPLEKYRMQMDEEQLQKLLSRFYNNELANLVDNLDVDEQKQNCYLKFRKNENKQEKIN